MFSPVPCGHMATRELDIIMITTKTDSDSRNLKVLGKFQYEQMVLTRKERWENGKIVRYSDYEYDLALHN
jgi:hypothetical protein